jgi:ArsR family transcriptional regulator
MDSKSIELISKALGDETRLRIFGVIAANKDLTCGELVALHGVTPATISHHLKILAEAGLIECRKKGQFVYSRTVPETIAEYGAALARVAKGTRTRVSGRKN